MINEEYQIHNFISSSGFGTVINYGSGSRTVINYGSDSGSGSTEVTLPTIRFRFHNTAPTYFWGYDKYCSENEFSFTINPVLNV